MKKPISSLDLNLLLCLQLLLQERSVTKAAKRMNVTPSAVSKSLAKLRDWFDDPLFVKTPLGLLPTPLTVSLEQDLADWMQIGNQILDKPHHTMPSAAAKDSCMPISQRRNGFARQIKTPETAILVSPSARWISMAAV